MKSDHFAHAEAVLELHAVLGVIANACLNEGARKKITSLHPRPDREWIEHSLEEIEDMRSYLLQQGDIPLADTSWGEMLDDAVQGHLLLEGKALLAIADLERTVMALKHSFKKKADQFPLLYGLVGALTSHEILLREIESAIEKDGTVLDGASKELASFRKKIASSREQLRHAAESSAQGYGDKAYATVLDGRFKLLIPRDRFRRRDGIVHSASHSGESVYFEPFQLVEKNNALEALLQSEKTEEMRILRVITGSVLAAANELINNIDGVEKLDVLRAKSIYGSRFKCISPAPSHGASLRLVDARHPLLEIAFQAASNGVVERDSEKGSRKKHQRQEQTAGSVVPLDLEIKEKEPILVITGPNAGGKTVALKTVGIVVLLYQCGLQVPCAQGTAIPVFGKIFADIGDEQSIDSSLSTFTSHLRHLDTMCREADRNTLCLIDEIGDGTDPDEGAALANATLEKLLGLGSIAIATTHYSKVKTHAMMTEGLSNASMLFNDETQEPLYVLMQGIAGTSRGLETARRCGFDAEVLEHAQAILGEKAFRLEILLSELEAGRLKLEEEREELRKQSEELKEVIKIYTERDRILKEMQAAHDDKAKKEAEELLLSARREVERIVKSIRESGARKKEIKEGHDRLRQLMERVRTRPERERPVIEERGKDLEPGDRVSMHASGFPSGTIIDVQNDRATVEINGKRIKISIKELYKISAGREQIPEQTAYDIDFEPLGSTTIDVRGKEREDALQAVDRFLDQAILNGVQQVMVIHGVGEGILLEAIGTLLQGDPRVKSYRRGFAGEGGEGVTIVKLL